MGVSNEIHIIRTGRKWKIKEDGEGWIYNRLFNRKWKIERAIEVFESGGTLRDYFDRIKLEPSHLNSPTVTYELVKDHFTKLRELRPTCEEIESYANKKISEKEEYGVVTYTDGDDYFLKLHDTYGIKPGGRVHVDLGCNGIHLMLDKNSSKEFIEFLKSVRNIT